MLLKIKELKKIVPLLSALMFLLCIQPVSGQEAAKDEYIKVTEKGTKYKIVGWETEVVYNPYYYTWHEWRDPVIAKKKGEITHMVKVSEFDRAPIFVYTGNCLTLDKPGEQMECSNKEIQKYVENNFFEYPDKAQEMEQEGLEYVSFTLNKDGKFEGDLRVMSKEKPCKGCSEAAADLVASMEDMWHPAIKDGQPVKTYLTIPVRFKFVDEKMMEKRFR